jgi:hypothetical protein
MTTLTTLRDKRRVYERDTLLSIEMLEHLNAVLPKPAVFEGGKR